jgi:calreticulin
MTPSSLLRCSPPRSATCSNAGKDLVLSYTVKHEQDLDCGGAYIKLLPAGVDAKSFGGDSPYSIMFGPDVCGYSTRKTHVIFTYEGKNLLTKKSIRCETDKVGHRYTLVVRPDNTYEVQIDGAKVESGNLADDWDFLKPKTIKDPKASKPADWADEAQIPDPADVKPENWDDVPAKIPDPAAKQPEDWDAEEDGEWEAPTIDNPAYKGEWKPKMIANPAYKGAWVHPEVPNPEYKEDAELYHVCKPCAAVGFELWQVKAGSIFDDIVVTDSLAEAEAFAAETFDVKRGPEKAAMEAAEKAKKEEEEAARKAREAEEAAKKAAESQKGGDAKEEEDDEEHDEL